MQNPCKKILLVDDNQDILEAVTLLLEDEGYSVTTSDTGEYLEQVENDKLPDIILMDMLLSGRDGRDLIQKLKTNPQTKHIPVILNSAHPEARNMWRESGADDFIEKPFAIDILLAVIEKHLSVIS